MEHYYEKLSESHKAILEKRVEGNLFLKMVNDIASCADEDDCSIETACKKYLETTSTEQTIRAEGGSYARGGQKATEKRGGGKIAKMVSLDNFPRGRSNCVSTCLVLLNFVSVSFLKGGSMKTFYYLLRVTSASIPNFLSWKEKLSVRGN